MTDMTDSTASMLERDETTGSGDRRCSRFVTCPLRRQGKEWERLPGSHPMPLHLKEAGPGQTPRKDCCGHLLANHNGI